MDLVFDLGRLFKTVVVLKFGSVSCSHRLFTSNYSDRQQVMQHLTSSSADLGPANDPDFV